MNPRTRSRTPASIGSNQTSPANSSLPSISAVVLFCSMAWSPPALANAGHGSLQRTGDYAASRFHHSRDGTGGDTSGQELCSHIEDLESARLSREDDEARNDVAEEQR